MKKPLYGILLLAFSCTSLAANIAYDAIITFFILPAPDSHVSTGDASAQFDKMIQKPGKVASTILKTLNTNTNEGIFATYYGYLSLSGMNGQITFPRSQKKTQLKLLITEYIEPVMMLNNTIHHWKIQEKIPAALYSLELLKPDSSDAKGGPYWKVESEKLPENMLIDANVITIFSQPKYIEVKTGIIPVRKGDTSYEAKAYEGNSLVLPPIWAKKGIEKIKPALSLLKTRQFFEPLHRENKKSTETYYQSLLTN